MKVKKTTYTVELTVTLLMSKEIKADSMEDALDKARDLAFDNDAGDEFIKVRAGWCINSTQSEVSGVFS